MSEWASGGGRAGSGPLFSERSQTNPPSSDFSATACLLNSPPDLFCVFTKQSLAFVASFALEGLFHCSDHSPSPLSYMPLCPFHPHSYRGYFAPPFVCLFHLPLYFPLSIALTSSLPLSTTVLLPDLNRDSTPLPLLPYSSTTSSCNLSYASLLSSTFCYPSFSYPTMFACARLSQPSF
jgi:hypothetical protein